MIMKRYISGAISYLPENKWRFNFNRVETKLKQKYPNDMVINPINLIPHKAIKTWQRYLRADIRELVTCDEIWVMNNWYRSKGAIVEILISLVLGIKIRIVPGWWIKWK